MLSRVISSLLRRPAGRAGDALARRAEEAIAEASEAAARGELVRARQVLEGALASGCDGAEMRRLLGSVLGACGDLDRAMSELERALAFEPEHAGALADLGNVHRLCGRASEAEACYRQALALDPANQTVRFNLAMMEDQTGRPEAAVRSLQALVRDCAHPEAVRALADMLDRLGRCDEAKATFREILLVHPEHAVAHAALGFLVLKRDLDARQALQHFDRAIELGYGTEEVWSNRGIALQDCGQVEEAIAAYDTALRIAPDYRLASFHRALARLLLGDFANGWPDYELRLLSEDRLRMPHSFPAWDGEPLRDGALLVEGEQGIGDEIMFASCLPDVLARQPECVLVCQDKLVPIFGRSFPGVRVIGRQQALADQPGAAFARVKATTPIGSLPLRYRMSLEQFPRHEGYLRADPALTAQYRDRLAATGSMLKVGLSWRGGSERTRRALRTLPADILQRLLETPGVRFFDLQYDSRGAGEGLDAALAAGKLVHWTDALQDYDRTAALVSALDVVVSVCTAVIHLGGALGRPVLVMAPHAPEWRYGLRGNRMAWYPSVHVERQPVAGDWDSVVHAVQAHLSALAAEHARGTRKDASAA